MLAGVAEPDDGVAVSQATLLLRDQLTEEGVDARLTVCAATAAPGAAAKLSVAGEAVNVGVIAVTVSVTLTCATGPVVGVSVTVPV